MPRKASDAPTGWLALSGFTASALLRFSISAMSHLRHSGAGRNPAKTNNPRSGQPKAFAPHAREIFINWIPACAGMTA
jgi:hypothetical protein